MSMSSAKDDVAAAIRTYFDAINQGVNSAPYTTGRLALMDDLLFRFNDSQEFRDSRLEVKHLDVVSCGIDEAEAELEAVLSYILIAPSLGEIPITRTYEGPVHLRRQEGEWRVVDYRREGRSVAASIFTDLGQGAAFGGCKIEPLALELGADVTLLVVRVINRAPHPVTLFEPIFRAGFRRKLGFIENDMNLSIPAESEIVTIVHAQLGVPLEKGSLDLNLRGQSRLGGERLRMRLRG